MVLTFCTLWALATFRMRLSMVHTELREWRRAMGVVKRPETSMVSDIIRVASFTRKFRIKVRLVVWFEVWSKALGSMTKVTMMTEFTCVTK